ncbi:MAG: tetratricopeptide repeat protein [Candidatus Eremiobacteraeota bacterium]|nr:tetratricopeptide repeat protein [Candidatus Eremiobacteraeota bacterium]
MHEGGWVERAAALFAAGDLVAAEGLARERLVGGDERADAWNIIGAVAFARRQYARAVAHFTRALALAPRNRSAQLNLARVYEATGQLSEAAARYTSIVEDDPGNADARLRLGIVLHQQGRLEDAAGVFQTVLRLSPHNAEAALDLGVTYNLMGRFEEARGILEPLAAAKPPSAPVLRALSDTLCRLHRPEVAADAARAALALDPTDAKALTLLGLAACEADDYDEAQRRFRAAIAMNPTDYEPEMNLGVVAERFGRLDEALLHGERAVALAPEEPLAHVNLGMTRLLGGDFERGWPELEWRMRGPRRQQLFPYADLLPLWNGEALDGRAVLIAREQGLGDFVLYSRFFEDARRRGVRLAIEVPEELSGLYRGFAGIDEALSGRCPLERVRSFAFHLPVCSLPFALGVRAESLPAKVAYVAADPARVEKFRARLARSGASRTVGLVWAGNPQHLLDRYRSVSLAEFAPLAGCAGIAFVSLQKGEAAAQAQAPPAGLDLLDLAPDLSDFEDTAAALEALDVIVTVDTVVAHLAAALGRPTWLLHGFSNYWLWQLDRADSPWYPSLRIFRQHHPMQWRDVFADVRAALDEGASS